MAKNIQSILCLSALSAGTAFAASVPNRVLVKYRTDQTSLSARASALGVMTPVIDTAALSVLRYSTNLDPKEAARRLMASGQVEWAQPDYLLSIMPIKASEADATVAFGRTSLTNLVEGFRQVTAAKPEPINAPELPSPAIDDSQLSDAWGISKIQAPEAWKLQRGSHKVLVADIDTGIDYTHEDLVNNLWDDIGYDFVANDKLPFDDHMHGTHTAGSIGAVGGNGKGVAGVSPVATIMALRFISAEGEGTTSDAVRAIDFAIKHGARVMSNSWGGPAEDEAENKALEEAVERANQADVLFVAAAGNDSADNDETPVYPAAIRKPNILTVAATSSKDGLAFFSNYGKETVHVAAPGFGVLSTTPGNEYKKISGTSMACPHVAGLAALVLAENPKLTAVEVKQIIMDTVDELPALKGKTVTGGRVNALKAIERARALAVR